MSGMMLAVMGGSADLIEIANRTVLSTQVDPDDATAGYSLKSNGRVEEEDFGVFTEVEDWVTPTGAANKYECRATLNSGALSSGTTGSWLALTSTRSWTVARTAIGTSSAQITVEIRLVGGSTVLDSAVIDLNATIEV